MTPTEVTLLALHKRVAVQVEEISEHYLGLSPLVARQRAAMNKLPFPTYRITESAKSPLLVNISDLARHIDEQHEAAQKEWQRSQA